MSAHLRTIHQPKCIRCGKPASKTLHNTRNAVIADYCVAHAQAALDAFKKSEEEE